jgi:hypothetical protein
MASGSDFSALASGYLLRPHLMIFSYSFGNPFDGVWSVALTADPGQGSGISWKSSREDSLLRGMIQCSLRLKSILLTLLAVPCDIDYRFTMISVDVFDVSHVSGSKDGSIQPDLSTVGQCSESSTIRLRRPS